MFHYFLLLALIPTATAEITADLNCTTYNGTGFVYTNVATICSNAISDASCAVLYPPIDDTPVAAGGDAARPFQCYTTAEDGAPVADMKKAALANCPKTCGFCCQAPAYSCPNAQFPSMNCATVTQTQCNSATWRPIIARECPASCGFCLEGGCVDAVPECANDLTICNSVQLQTFVNTNCRRTCGRCTATTVGTGTSCTTFNADSSTACASWAGNGFCTNTFYTAAQRKAYCARTCRIC